MRVLIIEDGDEYLDNLSRFVPGPDYLQAHTGAHALSLLAREPVDLIYLDMRFDRTPAEALLGERGQAIRRHNGNVERGLRYLADHQGLFILEALSHAGHTVPVILSYDFTNETARFARLNRRHPHLSWVPDIISPEEIRARMQRLAGNANPR